MALVTGIGDITDIFREKFPIAEEYFEETVVPVVREQAAKNPILAMVSAMILSQVFPRFSKFILIGGLYLGIKNAGGLKKII